MTGARTTTWSVRLRLTVLTAGLAALALAVGAFAFTTALSSARVADLDTLVRERAELVGSLVASGRVPEALPVSEPGEIAQVLDTDGRVIASSTNASRTLPILGPEELGALRDLSDEGRVLVTGTSVSTYDGDARVAVLVTTYRDQPAVVVVTLPLAEVHWLRQAFGVSLLVVVPLLTAVLAAVVWAVVGRVLGPVEELRRAAAQVARTGGPGSLPVPRADEIGALARTLNEMLDRLEASAARQRSFVADAAHELRSPLASLRAAVDVALAHPDAYPGTELPAALEDDLRRMQALVDDLLLLARVGSTPAQRERVDLADLATEAIAAAGASIPVGVEVTLHGAGAAWGDRDALVRVLRNLLDNAGRHAASRVLVTVADGAVTVDDDGSGIAPEDRERVFERFVRLEEARGREAGGSGLGLAIAREIARDNGGDVMLGEAPAGGLRATVVLATS